MMLEPEPHPEDRGIASPMERRAFVRLPSDLVSACRPAGNKHDVSWPGEVCNISRGGVGLLMQHRFRPGTALDVELRDRAGIFLRTVQVRVVHATAMLVDGRHGWLLGCSFEAPLSEEEFEGLQTS